MLYCKDNFVIDLDILDRTTLTVSPACAGSGK